MLPSTPCFLMATCSEDKRLSSLCPIHVSYKEARPTYKRATKPSQSQKAKTEKHTHKPKNPFKPILRSLKEPTKLSNLSAA